MSHRIQTDWRVPKKERHVFVGENRNFSLTFHPEGFIECDMAKTGSHEEMDQLFDWMGVTIAMVRNRHDSSLTENGDDPEGLMG